MPLLVYSELCKVRISLFSAFSALTGLLLAAREFRPEAVVLVAGVFLLACGSSALNQYQERKTDVLMPRTEGRPIPSGRMEPSHALFFSVMLISLGSLTLLLTGRAVAPVLGLLAVIWYNGLYTYLKRKSAFALIPGALVGAIPPAIGWVTGEGTFSDPGLIALCFFFFLWQVPHFWLLILSYGEEYRNAGLPSLTAIFTRTQLLRIIVNWIFATAVSCLFLSISGMVLTPLINYMLLGVSLWLMATAIRLLIQGGEVTSTYTSTFRRINTYMFLVMTLLSVDKLIV
ncbi:MAG TPA: protoheme IX farnesyltransferase [Thermodesulfovibrionales bacterium]|nr:protoheme IX farnesyltransferase [Thermodesulfovibrionales bacterium]